MGTTSGQYLLDWREAVIWLCLCNSQRNKEHKCKKTSDGLIQASGLLENSKQKQQSQSCYSSWPVAGHVYSQWEPLPLWPGRCRHMYLKGRQDPAPPSLLLDTDFSLTQCTSSQPSAVLPSKCPALWFAQTVSLVGGSSSPFCLLSNEGRNEHWYLSAVFNPLQYYGKIWSIFRLVLPALGHDTIPTRTARQKMRSGRKEKGRSLWSIKTITSLQPRDDQGPPANQVFSMLQWPIRNPFPCRFKWEALYPPRCLRADTNVGKKPDMSVCAAVGDMPWRFTQLMKNKKNLPLGGLGGQSKAVAISI